MCWKFHIVERRQHDRNDEHEHHGHGESLDPPAQRRRRERYQKAEPHVLGAPQRNDGAEHRQPQEQDGGELIRPGQRPIEDVTRDHARQQHQNLDRDQDGGRDFGDAGEQPVEAAERY
jgi:hypothetical protein